MPKTKPKRLRRNRDKYGCVGKISYISARKAWAVVKRMRRGSSYPCALCHGWHVTHFEKGHSIGR